MGIFKNTCPFLSEELEFYRKYYAYDRPTEVKVAVMLWCGECDFRRSPRSAYKIGNIWHVKTAEGIENCF